MPVAGVGGIFFRAQDPGALAAWYREHLGLDVGSTADAGPLVFAPFETGTDYWPAEHEFMLNLRVSDLDGLLAELRAHGIDVTVKAEWDSPETGRFARIHDPDGNPVELWEPSA